MSETRTLYFAKDKKVFPKVLPLKKLGPTEVRVKVYAIGINPIDFKTIDGQWADGAGQGNDFSGVVIEVGSDVKGTKVGDHVAGAAAGGNTEDIERGAFTDVLSIEEYLLFKFPQELTVNGHDEIEDGAPTSFEQAATIGVGWDTSAVALNGLHPQEKDWAVIYGGSGSLGFAAAQQARNIGYDVIVVSSPNEALYSGQHFQFLDRHDPLWPSKARGIASDRITFAFDTVSMGSTPEEVFRSVSPDYPSTIAFSHSWVHVSKEVRANNPKATERHPVFFQIAQVKKLFGDEVVANDPAVTARGPELIAGINAQIASGKIKTLPIKTLHGLDQVPEGLDLVRNGKVHGKKVVIRLA